jgi:hypothetical protein
LGRQLAFKKIKKKSKVNRKMCCCLVHIRSLKEGLAWHKIFRQV